MTALLKPQPAAAPVAMPLIGLAPLARMATRGESLLPVAQTLLGRLASNPDDAAAFLDLSTIEQLLGAGDNRIALQNQAFTRSRLFSQPAARPVAPRLLFFVAPGDFMANTPVEFLIDGLTAHVDFLYVAPGMDLAHEAPPHDLAFVAVAESQANKPILETIARFAPRWPKPLLNAPQNIARLTRDGAWALLRDAPGICYPRNVRVRREYLRDAVTAEDFPIIVRPVDSHAGIALEKLADVIELAAYLRAHGDAEFFFAPFVDYSSADKLFRKMRIAFVDGAPFPVHLAISSRWMIHYLNADMTGSAANRGEEAAFLEFFDDFARRHADAFVALQERLQLDYFLIDCAETRDGRLLVFEVGAAMIAHDMDCPITFPYKPAPMRRLFAAFQRMILQHVRAPA